MPVFVSAKDFTMETKISLYPNLLYRIASGNTGKAFGDYAWNIHLRFCQMLYPYDSPSKSAVVQKIRQQYLSKGRVLQDGSEFSPQRREECKEEEKKEEKPILL
jgi:hypothetical protein